MFCRNCGQEIAEGSSFCTNCGASTGSYNPTPQYFQPQQPVINVVNNNANMNYGYGYIHKKKWVAFFLCLLLGELGAHRFYVGKIGTGIIWLCTFGLCGFGWLFDLIIILVGGFKDKAGQPLF